VPEALTVLLDQLERLLDEVPDAELALALVIIDRDTIRIRQGQ
jgi:hypothetical protein